MERFLSDEWFAAVARTDAGSTAVVLRIHQVVTGGPDGDIEYAVLVSDGAAQVVPGRPDDADIRISQDYDTAVAVHRGELAIDDALAAGRIRITGDTAKLVAASGVLAAAGAVPVRKEHDGPQ